VVKAELYYGAYKSARREADLARKGTPIGPYDLQIAAIALANDCVLATHNIGEFSRIAGLRLEDWEDEK
jgi:tRNA(fMet)-specific endonuclease VapC